MQTSITIKRIRVTLNEKGNLEFHPPFGMTGKSLRRIVSKYQAAFDSAHACLMYPKTSVA